MRYYFFFLSALLTLLCPKFSFAAEMLLTPSRASVYEGELITIQVYLASPEERVNAAGGKLIFPHTLLALSRITVGSSIFSFWPEEPSSSIPGSIIFSGIVPGGFSSPEKGLLFSVVFKAVKSGTATLEMSNAEVLRDDGTGSAVSLHLQGSALTIERKVAGKEEKAPTPYRTTEAAVDFKDDKELPESFIPLVGQDPNLFDGRYFLVFASADKLSGIDRFEVQESPRPSGDDAKWVRAKSPYELSDQKLHSFVLVRVFDKAGNARVVTLEPPHPLAFYRKPLFWVILLGILVLSVPFFRRIKQL